MELFGIRLQIIPYLSKIAIKNRVYLKNSRFNEGKKSLSGVAQCTNLVRESNLSFRLLLHKQNLEPNSKMNWSNLNIKYLLFENYFLR